MMVSWPKFLSLSVTMLVLFLLKLLIIQVQVLYITKLAITRKINAMSCASTVEILHLGHKQNMLQCL